jgi:hypothetical protein
LVAQAAIDGDLRQGVVGCFHQLASSRNSPAGNEHERCCADACFESAEEMAVAEANYARKLGHADGPGEMRLDVRHHTTQLPPGKSAGCALDQVNCVTAQQRAPRIHFGVHRASIAPHRGLLVSSRRPKLDSMLVHCLRLLAAIYVFLTFLWLAAAHKPLAERWRSAAGIGPP